MILYSYPATPNTRRIAIYLKEKGLAVPYEEVLIDLAKGEQQEPEFLKINPLGKVPVLKTDDGVLINQSLSIVEYLEELNPEPSMFGGSPGERASVKAVERFIDAEVMGTMGIMAQQRMPLYVERYGSSQDVIDYARRRQQLALDYLDQYIGENEFFAGKQVTIADCTMFAIYEFAFLVKAPLTENHPNLLRWHQAFSQRSSVQLDSGASQEIQGTKDL